jgi:hypothetical protein
VLASLSEAQLRQVMQGITLLGETFKDVKTL